MTEELNDNRLPRSAHNDSQPSLPGSNDQSNPPTRNTNSTDCFVPRNDSQPSLRGGTTQTSLRGGTTQPSLRGGTTKQSTNTEHATNRLQRYARNDVTKQSDALIPELRFKDFDGEWKKSFLKKVAVVNPRTNELPEKFIYIDLESVTKGILIKEEEICLNEAPSRAQRLLDKDDILYQTVRPYQKNNLYFDRDGDYVASTGYAQIKAKGDSKYLFQFLHTTPFVNIVNRWSTGTSYPAISPSELVKIQIAFPTLPEQQKIASFLSAVDEKIQQLSKKKALLEQYKKGVMQQLFSGQLRFKPDMTTETSMRGTKQSVQNEAKFPNWEEKQLKDVLFEHKTKNKEGSVEEVFSVAKRKGVINQIEHLGRSYAADSTLHYKVVFPGDLIYTKSPTKDFPFGIIKQNLTGRKGLVSPLYVVTKPQTDSLGFMFHCHFLYWVNVYNYLVPLVQKGAKNTMNINNDDFLNGAKFKLPTSEKEQQKIASYLSSIDAKIEGVSNQISQTQSFKKGLLQQMFV